jgi:putative phosphoribosylformylglycinamidine synthase
MTPEQLKASILQYAIQGKLVEQRVEEGTGEELFQEIKRKREVLIKEKIIKKDKRTNSIINFQNVPFDIPENWMWVTLGSILNKLTDGTHKTPKYTSTGVRFVSVKDMSNGFLSLENTKFISEEEHKELYARCNPEKGDLILSKVGTTGVPAIVDTAEPFSLFVSVALLKFDCKCIDVEFLYYMLMSPLVQAQATENTRGVGNKNWVLDAIASTMVVLPPLSEQKRIVQKIKELLPYVDRYATAYEKLERFNAKFPEDMKKSILQYAIQGKLVEQRPEEGTGEELYQQIQAEKQHLIAEKKIKKEKPLPEIAENEIPFDIPESWKWVRLNNIAESIVDCPHSTPKYLDMETEYCTIDTNCIDGKGDITKWRYVDADTYTARIARLTPQKDDIVYTREGSICRAAILPEGPKVCLGQRVMLIRSANGVFPQFIRRLLMSPMVIRKLTEQQKGIGAKHVNVSDVCNLILPLPPLAEQERIVAKLEEILPLCERLK